MVQEEKEKTGKHWKSDQPAICKLLKGPYLPKWAMPRHQLRTTKVCERKEPLRSVKGILFTGLKGQTLRESLEIIKLG